MRVFALRGFRSEVVAADLHHATVGLRMPAIMRSVVVLPAPLGPRKPNNSPCGTFRSIPSTAVKLPYAW